MTEMQPRLIVNYLIASINQRSAGDDIRFAPTAAIQQAITPLDFALILRLNELLDAFHLPTPLLLRYRSHSDSYQKR